MHAPGWTRLILKALKTTHKTVAAASSKAVATIPPYTEGGRDFPLVAKVVNEQRRDINLKSFIGCNYP